MKMKKIGLLLLVMFTASMVFANGDQDGGASAGQSGKTKVAYPLQSFESLDPYYTTGHTIITLGYQIYEPLWTVDEDGKEIGVIAKDWTINDNIVDVTIYDYVYDSAGNHITADDIVFCYNEWMKAGKARNCKYFKSVTKTGDYSVKIELSLKPYVTLLSGSRVYIVSEKAYTAPDADFVNKPIATGHYTVRKFVSGTQAIFDKRDSHWQSDKDESLVPFLYKANADVVQIDVILESQQVQTALETGVIQAGPVSPTIAELLESSKRVNVVTRPGNYSHSIMFNCFDGPFKDNPALRKAVMYAINTDDIAKAVTKGTGHASVTVGNEKLSGFQAKWNNEDYYGYDLAKAKSLMAEAGYPNGGLTLRWLGKTDEFVTLTAQILQAQLSEIGIDLKIESLDNTSYMNKRPAFSKGWDLVWGDSVPKGNMVLSFQSYVDITRYDGGNMCGVYDEHLQDLLISALYDQNSGNIDALHQYVKDQAFVYGSYVDLNFYGVADGVTMVASNDGEASPGAFLLSDDYSVFE